MFKYKIHKTADNKAFKEACKSIEKNLDGIENQRLVADVDGSLIQVYYTQRGEVTVFNDYEVDAVYAESEVDLSNII